MNHRGAWQGLFHCHFSIFCWGRLGAGAPGETWAEFTGLGLTFHGRRLTGRSWSRGAAPGQRARRRRSASGGRRSRPAPSPEQPWRPWSRRPSRRLQARRAADINGGEPRFPWHLWQSGTWTGDFGEKKCSSRIQPSDIRDAGSLKFFKAVIYLVDQRNELRKNCNMLDMDIGGRGGGGVAHQIQQAQL